MSEINASNFKKEHGDLAPDLVGVTELTSPYFFVPPSGTTAERPEDCEPGTLRFNTDIGNLEVFRGKTIGWESINRRDNQYLGGYSGSGYNSPAGTGTRGFKIGGYYPAYTNIIDYVTISTFGNAIQFGTLNTATHLAAGTSSNTRAIAGGGSPSIDEIQFFTVSTLGDAQDFGNLSETRYGLGAVSNSTRGVFCTGYLGGPSHYANKNNIDYVTIASTGNAQDFGDSVTPAYGLSTVNSTTRGIMAGGTNPTPGGSQVNAMSFITISTTGNSLDFGDTHRTQYYTHSCICSATRGIFGGGYFPAAPSNTSKIHFITMATLGDSIDFGDLTQARFSASGTSSSTRGIFMSGRTPGLVTTIDSIEIATTGDAIDFGDNTSSEAYSTATSTGHGGLQ